MWSPKTELPAASAIARPKGAPAPGRPESSTLGDNRRPPTPQRTLAVVLGMPPSVGVVFSPERHEPVGHAPVAALFREPVHVVDLAILQSMEVPFSHPGGSQAGDLLAMGPPPIGKSRQGKVSGEGAREPPGLTLEHGKRDDAKR